MKAISFTTASAILLLCHATSYGADANWELQRDSSGIQVYTRDVVGSPFKEVRTTTVVSDIRLASLAALIEDAQACPNWADRCKESYVYERLSETEAYVYTQTDMPFPIKDRDHLAHVEWSQDPETLEVSMHSQSANGVLPLTDGMVRLTEASVSWHFKPMASGTVQVSNQAHINPGSSLPAWVTNLLLVDTPYTTMQQFIAEARIDKYSDATVSFIEEP